MGRGLRWDDGYFAGTLPRRTLLIPAQAGIHGREVVLCGEVVGHRSWRAERCHQPAKRAEPSRTVRFERSLKGRKSHSGIDLPNR